MAKDSRFRLGLGSAVLDPYSLKQQQQQQKNKVK